MPQAKSHQDTVSSELLEYFNSRGTSSLRALCDKSLMVNSAMLDSFSPSDPAMQFPLDALIDACRSRFPGIKFFPEDASSSGNRLVLHWRAEYAPDRDGVSVVSIPCVCRVTVDCQKIREISFIVDDYSFLLQRGMICAEPGRSIGSSATVNQTAAESLRQAISEKSPLNDAWGVDTKVFASMEIYANLDEGIRTETLRLEGPGKMDLLPMFIRQRVGEPIEVSLRDGISQGYTTTFRGKMRGSIGSGRQRYDLVCGLVSPSTHVAECWVKITPPPTLAECLL